jgi:peptidyl-prolyl cis-trans isomerase A (cyclophilin A)
MTLARHTLNVLVFGVSLVTAAAAVAQPAVVTDKAAAVIQTPSWKAKAGTYAVFETTKGTIVCRLMPETAPKTVANFVGLASGTKEYTDIKTRQKKTGHYFDGQVFHRVIDNFMIQGGDPRGDGTGGPGYKFEDEFSPNVVFDRPGRLAMANSGPGTNGSQFFITHKAVPHLNQRHTIFGQVVEGQNIVNEIGKVKTANERPVTPVVMKSVRIEEVKG